MVVHSAAVTGSIPGLTRLPPWTPAFAGMTHADGRGTQIARSWIWSAEGGESPVEPIKSHGPAGNDFVPSMTVIDPRALAKVGLVFHDGFFVHRRRKRSCVNAIALQTVADPQAGHLARSVRVERLRGLWAVHYVVSGRDRHCRGSGCHSPDGRRQGETKATGLGGYLYVFEHVRLA